MSDKKKTRPVKEIWWEGDDLHVVFADDGTETVFKNATVTGYQDGIMSGKSVSIVPAKFIGEFE